MSGATTLRTENGWRWFGERWADAVACVLGQITSAQWEATVCDEAPESPTQAVSVQFAAENSLEGRTVWSCSIEDALSLVELFTGARAEKWDTEQQEAFEELCRQMAGQLSASLRSEVGEVSFHCEPAGSGVAGRRQLLTLRGPGSVQAQMFAAIDDELERSLQPEEPKTLATTTASINNLDLLMDVELAVTLRFGECAMLLQEILDLQTGSVIQLDREIQQPVDLLLDGRVIARGEVVVVDGNYGLRVSQISGPSTGFLA